MLKIALVFFFESSRFHSVKVHYGILMEENVLLTENDDVFVAGAGYEYNNYSILIGDYAVVIGEDRVCIEYVKIIGV